MPRTLTGSRRTDALVPTALALVGAVKTLDPDEVARILAEVDPAALAVVLAAMVPDDQPVSVLLAWLANPDEYARLIGLGVGSTTASQLAAAHTTA